MFRALSCFSTYQYRSNQKVKTLIKYHNKKICKSPTKKNKIQTESIFPKNMVVGCHLLSTYAVKIKSLSPLPMYAPVHFWKIPSPLTYSQFYAKSLTPFTKRDFIQQIFFNVWIWSKKKRRTRKINNNKGFKEKFSFSLLIEWKEILRWKDILKLQ